MSLPFVNQSKPRPLAMEPLLLGSRQIPLLLVRHPNDQVPPVGAAVKIDVTKPAHVLT